ncbi:MAG: septal ring lytic transglycosylase RlpA family protein [Hyphomicrobiales bacterium]|nr:septal ring lytic transglycosylase RlpA family protein [Hyphomicrobiales bacterium]
MAAGLALIGGLGPARAQNVTAFAGLASYYDKDYAGKTAAGERYDGTRFTAAHRTLPFGTRVVVTDKRTKRTVTVIINDRGPFIKGRVIDLSYAAATTLRMHDRGVIEVTATVE